MASETAFGRVPERSKHLSRRLGIVGIGLLCVFIHAEENPPRSNRVGKTIYVSKLGDDSDGSSWARAFRTIQRALDAVPDQYGGHHIIVRPDTYMEANLYPAYRGAFGAYNVLEADHDGKFGSGTGGMAVIDSGDPAQGFKSYDWWGPIRAYKKDWSAAHKKETFSAVAWDRWIIRHMYVTGGDAGLFFDLVDKPEPFTVVIDDCVSIGRAFGGGVANFLSRPGEPCMFRRSKLWCLDWWGDAAGAYVRAEHATMPSHSDVVFEDCALVGPDNALQAGNPGYVGFTRVKLKGCQLVSLNFSQPTGKPGTGIIHSTIDGKLLQVDLEDCTLMGYKVFGAGTNDVAYTTKGDVKAYVQFQQDVPKSIYRLGHWPVEAFQMIMLAPKPTRTTLLQSDQLDLGDGCEAAPIVWDGRLILLRCVRPASGGKRSDYYITLEDSSSGRVLAKFGEGYGLASAIVHDHTLYVFASRYESGTWNDVTLLKSTNLIDWQQKQVISQESEHLFNSSVCSVDSSRFVMAYETDDPKFTPFTVKFAVSSNLVDWVKLPDAVFGPYRYAACPCIRYDKGSYYLLYLERRTPRWYFETYIARSRDLKSWELSPVNPVLAPGLADGINASDPDLVEFEGRTFVYYSVGDQRTWSKLKRTSYPGSIYEFFNAWFPRSFGEAVH